MPVVSPDPVEPLQLRDLGHELSQALAISSILAVLIRVLCVEGTRHRSLLCRPQTQVGSTFTVQPAGWYFEQCPEWGRPFACWRSSSPMSCVSVCCSGSDMTVRPCCPKVTLRCCPQNPPRTLPNIGPETLKPRDRPHRGALNGVALVCNL